MEQLRLIAYRVTNVALDFVIFLVAFVLGYGAFLFQKEGRLNSELFFSYDWQILLCLYLIFYGCNFFYLTIYRLYHTPTIRDRNATIQLYFNATSMALLLAALIAFFFPFLATSRVMLLSAEAFAFTFLLVKDRTINRLLRRYRSDPRFQRRAVIVGENPVSISTVNRQCTKDPLLGLSIVGNIAPNKEEPTTENSNKYTTEYLGTIEELGAILDRYVIDIVVMIGSDIQPNDLEESIDICEARGLEVWLHLDVLDRLVYRANLSNTWGISFLNFNSHPPSAVGLFLKAVFDRIASFFLLIIFSPLLLLVALLVKLTSPGPIIFVQERAGINGKRFKFYKFRSMYKDAEARKKELLDKNENTGPAFKLRDDPRITPLGKFIRKSSIDELPQLFNVLVGDMSLVGPRPLPLSEVREFKGWHRRRLSMRPGITGLWQVAGRSDIDDFNSWAKLDLQYIDTWSFTFDLVILLRTIPAVLSMKGAR